MKHKKIILIIVFSFLPAIILQSCRQLTGVSDPGFPETIGSEKPKTLLITSPKFGDVYMPGETIEIKWISSSSVEKVDIMLFRKYELKKLLAQQLINNNKFRWKIPLSINHSLHYIIKIRAYPDTSITDKSGQFGITNN